MSEIGVCSFMIQKYRKSICNTFVPLESYEGLSTNFPLRHNIRTKRGSAVETLYVEPRASDHVTKVMARSSGLVMVCSAENDLHFCPQQSSAQGNRLTVHVR